jgi:tRNA threonylcarbamoyl adenosine modification protein YeaZ
VSLILAIDTSGGTSVAIVQEGKTLASLSIDDPMGHSENIGNAIAQVLREASVSPKQLSAVVVGRGPAPFTGLRVGIAAAIAFAEGIAKPLLGVVSHDAIAFAALTAKIGELGDSAESGVSVSATNPLLVTTDARRKEVYWSLYSGLDSHGAPIAVAGPNVNKPADLEEILTERNVNPIRTDAVLNATALALVAEAKIAAGINLDDVSALYLRAPDAVEPKAHGKFGKPVSS